MGWFAAASALVMACHGATDPPPVATPAPAPATTHTLDQLRLWVTSIGAHDKRLIEAAISDAIIVRSGDPVQDLIISGRDEWRASVADTKPRHCELQLAIARGADAIGLALCSTTFQVKRAPTERTITTLRAYELHVDARGAIDQVVFWSDAERFARQIGADIDAPVEPDAAWTAPVVASAHLDEHEAANARTASEMIAALSRGDVAGFTRHLGPRYELHPLHRATPQVFDPASYAAVLREDLARSATSSYTLHAVLAAEDWVAVRFGHGYRTPTGREAYTSNLWLVRFASGVAVETWAVSSRYSEALQTGRLQNGELSRKIVQAMN